MASPASTTMHVDQKHEYVSRCVIFHVHLLECLVFVRIVLCVVVQVFNAVNKQQKELEEKLQKVGTSEQKRSKGIVWINYLEASFLVLEPSSIVQAILIPYQLTVAICSWVGMDGTTTVV